MSRKPRVGVGRYQLLTTAETLGSSASLASRDRWLAAQPMSLAKVATISTFTPPIRTWAPIFDTRAPTSSRARSIAGRRLSLLYRALFARRPRTKAVVPARSLPRSVARRTICVQRPLARSLSVAHNGTVYFGPGTHSFGMAARFDNPIATTSIPRTPPRRSAGTATTPSPPQDDHLLKFRGALVSREAGRVAAGSARPATAFVAGDGAERTLLRLSDEAVLRVIPSAARSKTW